MEKINSLFNKILSVLERNKANLTNPKIEFIFKDSEFSNMLDSSFNEKNKFLIFEVDGIPSYIDLNNKSQTIPVFTNLSSTSSIENLNCIPAKYSIMTRSKVDNSEFSFSSYFQLFENLFYTKNSTDIEVNNKVSNSINSSYIGNLISIQSENSTYIIDSKNNDLIIYELNFFGKSKIELIRWHSCINNKILVVEKDFSTIYLILNNELKTEKVIYYSNVVDAKYSNDGK